MYVISDAKRFRFLYVVDDKDKIVSRAVLERRAELKLSLRDVATLSEGAISHGHLGNLENGSTSWKGAKYAVLRGIERALEWKAGYLSDLIHGTANPAVEDIVTELVTSDYVSKIVVLLSYDGNEIGERTVMVKKENAKGKLFAFTNAQNTVHNIGIGQGVKVNTDRVFESGDMVLVRASGQVILAYTQDTKASRVKTSQGLELKTDKVFGKVVERLEIEGEFKEPKKLN